MEGDVSSILSRPTLPPSSPDPNTLNNNNGGNVHRYASRDIRTREAQSEIEKWDAWNECAGMSRTEAKRRYISTLIETMKEYASGTQESRELIGELEFVWSQIRSQPGSSEEEGSGNDGDSPTRRLERAGLRPTDSYSSIPPGRTETDGRERSSDTLQDSGMRVLSPVSQDRDLIEGEEADHPAEKDDNSDDDYRDTSEDPLPTSSDQHNTFSRDRWRRTIESALSKLTTEIAALREQIEMSQQSSSSLLWPLRSSSRRNRHGLLAWIRWLIWISLRQVLLHTVLVAAVMLWGRWKGDRRLEMWVRRRLEEGRTWFRTLTVTRRVGGWL